MAESVQGRCLHLRVPLVWESGPDKGEPRSVGIVLDRSKGIVAVTAWCSRCGAIECTGLQDNTYWRTSRPQTKRTQHE